MFIGILIILLLSFSPVVIPWLAAHFVGVRFGFWVGALIFVAFFGLAIFGHFDTEYACDTARIKIVGDDMIDSDAGCWSSAVIWIGALFYSVLVLPLLVLLPLHFMGREKSVPSTHAQI
jgi:hypothetical protein